MYGSNKAFINIEVCMLLFRVYVLTLLRYTMSRSTLSSMIVPYRGKVWEWNGVECLAIKAIIIPPGISSATGH